MADQWWKIEPGPNEPAASIVDQFKDVFAITGVPRGAGLIERL